MSETPASLLARRLARVLRLSVFALPAAAACGGHVVIDGTGGASGTSSSAQSGTGGTSGTGGAMAVCAQGLGCPDGPGGPGPEWMACFTPSQGTACPAAADALPFFGHGCVLVKSVFAACAGGPAGQCCYNVSASCACLGRPFLVEGAPLVAATRDGDDGGWHGEQALDVSDLPRATREALAAAYLEDALGEHASVASFGRFALELLALGAPAELVEAAHHAALDEVRHARITFGFASAFGGAPVGPGAFPLASVVHLRTDVASFARAAVIEGCIRETLAALLAAERAAVATDTRVKAGLLSIAEDEARHAELAWRTVAWALGAGGDEVAGVVFGTLAEAARHAPEVPGGASERIDLRAFGVLDARATREILAAGLAEIVGPSARALGEGRRARGSSPPRAPARQGSPVRPSGRLVFG